MEVVKGDMDQNQKFGEDKLLIFLFLLLFFKADRKGDMKERFSEILLKV